MTTLPTTTVDTTMTNVDTTYNLRFGTDAGDRYTNLVDAQDAADDLASYNGNDIRILNDAYQLVAIRRWYGTLDGLDEQSSPLQFGNMGYYADWSEE